MYFFSSPPPTAKALARQQHTSKTPQNTNKTTQTTEGRSLLLYRKRNKKREGSKNPALVHRRYEINTKPPPSNSFRDEIRSRPLRKETCTLLSVRLSVRLLAPYRALPPSLREGRAARATTEQPLASHPSAYFV